MSRLRLVVVVLVVAACGAGPGSPSPAAPTALSAAPSAAASADLEGMTPLRVGLLPAGRYTTSRFEPRLELTFGGDWMMLFADDPDEVAFERRSPLAFFNIGRISQVIDPSTDQGIDVPDDLATWLAAHPALEVKSDEPATIAGLSGRMIEANVRTAGETEMFGYPTGNMRVISGDRVRFYVVPLDGPDLALTVGSKIDTFGDAMDSVEPIIDSLAVGSTD